MSYFGDWFDSDDAYFFDWFDEPEDDAPPSGGGGVSRSRILGNVNPRPQVPPWYQINGAAGQALTGIRRFLHDAQGRDELWGNHVEVEFSGAGASVPVATGLGGPLKGYKIVRADSDIRVFDGEASSPDVPRGTHYLQASGAGKVTLYVY